MINELYDNLILDTDSYKASHSFQYPPGTTHVYSYIESRGGKFDKTLFFGLQMYLKRYLSCRITTKMIDQAEKFWAMHGVPFNRALWDYIVEKHDGKLPVHIKAVREGMIIPTHNVLVTIVNTDPNCFWLTSYLETALLRAVWYPTTVSTVSWHAKQIIKSALDTSSDDTASQLPFKLHDFGARGVSSKESAGIGGAAHAVNFMGSDTATGIIAANIWYDEAMACYSIPAAEHSTITSWGKDNEATAYENMLAQFAGKGKILAVVSDSYDIMNAVNNIWGTSLKDEVIDSGATVVVRPDSGDPLVVPVDVIDALGEKFGYTVNSKGYKVLHPSVRVIQGDGITIDSLPIILSNLLARGWSADNIAFGMGGGLLQQVNRDTQKFAMKCSAVMVDGEWRDVFKDPVTDAGKKSKRGRFVLTKESGNWETVPIGSGFDWADYLTTVFKDGEIRKEWSFPEVREASNI